MWPHPAPGWEQPASLVTTLVPLCTPLSLYPEYPLRLSWGQLLPSASCYYQQFRAQFSSPLLPPLVADTGHMTCSAHLITGSQCTVGKLGELDLHLIQAQFEWFRSTFKCFLVVIWTKRHQEACVPPSYTRGRPLECLKLLPKLPRNC